MALAYIHLFTPTLTVVKGGVKKKFLKNIGECEFEYHLK